VFTGVLRELQGLKNMDGTGQNQSGLGCIESQQESPTVVSPYLTLSAKQRARTMGYIYFVECAGFVKIGHSMRPKRRVLAMQVSNPLQCRLLGYMRGGTDAEGKIHRNMKRRSLHHRGEWFHLTEDLRAAIEEVLEEDGVDD